MINENKSKFGNKYTKNKEFSKQDITLILYTSIFIKIIIYPLQGRIAFKFEVMNSLC